jgi:hypothetical protein
MSLRFLTCKQEMEVYLQECVENNNRWMARVQELEVGPHSGNDEAISAQAADDYFNVFPLTLPPSRQVTGDDAHPSPSNSGMVSPSGTENPNLYALLGFPNMLSSDMSSAFSSIKLEEHAAIRAAGKMGSRQQKKINRNSWCATVPNRFTGTQPSSSPLAHVQESSGSSSSDMA